MPKRSPKKKQKWLKKQVNIVKHIDEVWADARQDDIVIVVMGPTGVGKSTFANHLAKSVDQSVKVGDDLESCTVNLQPIPIPAAKVPNNIAIDGPRLVIVDTPGFDDTYADDSEILRRIAVWLASSYSKDMKLGGVIYLHDISQARMLGTTRRNFDMFQVLCGDSAAKSMILCTTKWTEVPSDVERRREDQLHQKFWGKLTKLGARPVRFSNDSDSAWNMVQQLLNGKIGDDRILQIQDELVELEKTIPMTEAGQKLRYTLEEVLEMQQDSVKNLEGQEQMKEKLQLIDNLMGQIDQLKVPLWDRIKSRFVKEKPVDAQ